MTSIAKHIAAFCTLLLLPLLAQSQHYWLQPDPGRPAKKAPVRLSLLYGDSLQPKAGGEVPKLQRFMLYRGKDSTSLSEGTTGTTLVLAPDHLKGTSLAAATLTLPATTLLLPQLQKQLTKEQKTLLALQDTSQWRNGVQAERIVYAKALIPQPADKDKEKVNARQLNHELEVIPNKDPGQVKVGEEMVIQLLLHQRTLPNHRFTLWRQEKNGKITKSEMVTNKYGVRLFSIAKPGTYLIQVSQEGPHQFGLSEEVRWQSLEANYYFVVE